LKYLCKLFYALLISFVFALGLKTATFAENLVIYQISDEQTLAKGVTYAKTRQVTQAGMRDIYTLTIDLTNPYITLGAAESKKEYSLKEPLTELLADNGAIAGVNGDFFGMAGTRSASFGPVIKKGELVSVNTGVNAGAIDYGTFFISNDNNPFFAFIRTNMSFYNNGVKNIDTLSINKITDMVRPVVVTKAAMDNTAAIDARFPGLYKIAVKDEKITYISGKGETVTVPEGGYLIVMDANTANHRIFSFHVGDRGILQFSAGVDFDTVKTAIGGGGGILKNGQLSNEGSPVSGNSRQPRTAIGITQNNKKIILVAVDGRTHSVGATHEEMADIMLKLGAYNAMHLDGGGSTTMAVQLPGEMRPSIVNRVSDGAQRKIINGLGVYDYAPVGEVTQLAVSAGEKNIVYAQAGVNLYVYGTDEYLHRMPVDKSAVLLTADDPNGFFANGVYYPQSIGEINVLAVYYGLTAQAKLKCRQLKEIRPNLPNIKAMEDDIIPLSFTGIDNTGEESRINSPMTYNIVPAGAGVIENGAFIPKMNTDGYIECTLAGVSCYISFQIGGDLSTIEPFEGGRKITFASAPDAVTGSVSYVTEPVVSGSWSAKLSYNIPAGDETQAAYLVLDNGINIEGSPMAIRTRVYGNMSGLWLRGRVIDADGDTHVVDFAGEINWDGWKVLNASLPAGITYPITLERLYVVTLQSEEFQTGNIYFGDIQAVYPRADSNILLPAAQKFSDPLRVSLSDIISTTGYDITVLGRTLPENEKPGSYTPTISKITDIITKNTRRTLYVGKTEMPLDIGVAVYKWNENYFYHYDENVTILQMSAAGGGITAHNPWQWGRMLTDIKTSGKKNVIITMDKNPLYLPEPRETKLFCDALSQLKEQGLNIFVISAEGAGTAAELINGVRYINLGTLWMQDGSINSNFRILRFRVSGDEMRFELRGLE